MTGFVTYEERLDRDTRWAFNQGSLHFENASYVHHTMRRTARRLEALGVDYAVIGAMAMFLHGYRRFTEDVNVLVKPAGLELVRARLPEDGYVLTRPGGKSLHDVVTGVRVEFVVAGDRVAHGGDNTVVYPEPAAAVVDLAGVRTAKLSVLVDLKLVAGTAPTRGKHTADVQEMIRVLGLPERIAHELHESVRPVYVKMWADVQNLPPDE